MTRIALDSNVLIYAEIEPQTVKGKRAIEMILRVARDGVIPVQVIGEFLRFVQRRSPATFEQAIAQAGLYRKTFLVPATTEAVLVAATELGRSAQLQIWDGAVIAASAQAGAAILLTEDMQDGQLLGGLRLINPFVTKNQAAIEAALAV